MDAALASVFCSEEDAAAEAPTPGLRCEGGSEEDAVAESLRMQQPLTPSLRCGKDSVANVERQRLRKDSPAAADPFAPCIEVLQEETAANVRVRRLRTKSLAPCIEVTAASPLTQAQQLTMRGLNIQYPFSRLIMLGAKTIEARTYALGHRSIAHAGEEMFLIETLGSKRSKPAVVGDLSIGAPPDHAQVMGTVSFRSSSKYTCLSAWRNDRLKHRIQEGSKYDWNGTGEMHAWGVGKVQRFSRPVAAGSKTQVGYGTPRTLEVTGLLADGSS